MDSLAPIEQVAQRIHLIRGQKAMLDSDLAMIYGVTTRHLNQAVRRNIARFPPDFMLRLTPLETASLRSQIVISKKGRGGRRYSPFVFSEHGAVMLSSVLKSSVAVQASILIARAFVKLREVLTVNRDLARRFDELEQRVEGHDVRLTRLVADIRRLLAPPREPRRKIGFRP